MSLADPYTTQTSASGRQSEALNSLVRRVTALERGGSGVVSIGGGSVVDATTTVKGKLQLAGDIAGTAAAPVVKKLTSLGTTAMTDRILDDTAHDGAGDWTGGPEGTRYEIRHGGTGAPHLATGPTLRILALSEYTGALQGGVDYSTVTVKVRGLSGSTSQIQAGSLFSQSFSTQTPSASVVPDAQAISGIGELATGAKARAIGGFFYGRINSDADSTGAATGVEAAVQNNRADHTVNTSGTGAGSQTMGLWVPALSYQGGPGYRSAAGIQIGASTGSSWQVGIYVGFKSAGSIIEEATFRDFGQADWSIDIDGPHANAAIGIGPGSGGVCIGRSSKFALAALDLGWDATGTASTVAADGILFGNDTSLYRAGASLLKTDDQFAAPRMSVQGTAGTGWLSFASQGATIASATNTVYVGDSGGTTTLRFKDSAGVVNTLLPMAATGTALTLFSGAMTDRLLSDTTHGDNQAYFGISSVGQRYDRRHGTTAAPVTTIYPTDKISRLIDFNAAAITAAGGNAIPPSLFAASEIGARGTASNLAQVTGQIVWGRSAATTAEVFPTVAPDALGVHSVGWISDSGVGRGIGAAVQGRTTSVATDRVTGIEVQTWQDSGAHSTYDATGVGTGSWGVLVNNAGTYNASTGVYFKNSGAGKYLVGIGIPSTDPITTTTFRDDGNAPTCIQINGARATAIGIAASAGWVGIGVVVPNCALELASSTATTGGIGFGTEHRLFRSSSTLVAFQSGTTFQAGGLAISATAGTGFLQMNEQGTVPVTPSNTALRLYAWDNAGTTELRYLNSSGVPVTLGAAGAGGFISSTTDVGTGAGTPLDLDVTANNLTASIPTTATPQVTSLSAGLSSATPAAGDEGIFLAATASSTVAMTEIFSKTSTSALHVWGVDSTITVPRFKLALNSTNVVEAIWGNGGSFDVRVGRSAANTLAITGGASGTVAGHLNFTVAASSIKFDAGGFISAAAAGTGLKIGNLATDELGLWAATPVAQPAAIADATGGAVADTQARTALNDLLAKLRTVGIIAT